jgi:hypothetical protein
MTPSENMSKRLDPASPGKYSNPAPPTIRSTA